MGKWFKRNKKRVTTGLIALILVLFTAYTQSSEGNGSFFENLTEELGVSHYFEKEPESVALADEDFYQELADLEYDPELYPNNFVEIESEGLTDTQWDMIEEFGSQEIWEDYQVDTDGRPRQATAYITKESLPSGDRPSFASSTHLGGELVDGYYAPEKETWTSDTRNDNGNVISQNAEMQLIGYRGWLYNKSHLIAYSLGGGMLPENLILGTRAQNVGNSGNNGGQASIEVPTREALNENPDAEIFYQVIPVYKENDDVMPVGVYSKAYSVNDDGETLDYATYNFNNQEGIKLDYKTGIWEITDDRVEVIKTNVNYGD